MPEGPEVQTVVNTLAPHVVGRTIDRIVVRSERQIFYPASGEFVQTLTGMLITSIARRGKYILITAGERTLICHLMMSGRLTVVPAGAAEDKHTHVIFHLAGGMQLRYQDQRKFGGFFLPDGPVGMPPGLLAMGPDPLDDRGFTLNFLAGALAVRKGPLKAALLDQSVCPGVGNIYADEVCFAARIHPSAPANSLTRAQVEAVREAVRRVLALAIQKRGTTFSLYRDGEGRAGDMYSELMVFDRAGASCKTCGATIAKVVVAGRGTHFCPTCQKSPADVVLQERRPRAKRKP